MEDYVISVNKIEELQMINDRQSLETIMERARRTILGGRVTILMRGGVKFDTISDEAEFKRFREKVFKYVK